MVANGKTVVGYVQGAFLELNGITGKATFALAGGDTITVHEEVIEFPFSLVLEST